ncbi:HhoA/HhoB/HtrA family serine endopeptidase [Acaryochloris sp. IP29b_bin.148]|uniref:HhoA/HhoB/HtrA family serine endopeptidase n=1 Tax=Acaryochloris sp. IP29b_bin.148 TaxID=2969218 RepID=UPI00262FA7BB|nr:HhoA/HhoB/HtrA family serine endopeptidase [Acaryochloris sp. IP29b_bin.148]
MLFSQFFQVLFSLARPMQRSAWLQRGLATVLMVGFTVGSVVPVQAEVAPASPAAKILTSATTGAPHNFISDVVQKVGDTVVRIDTERTVVRPAADPFFDDPFLRDFFGPEGYPRGPREDRLRGQGSGFIIESSGIILTNAHVVSKADTVSVTLKDGRIFEGDVRGVDEVSDLAVVKLKGVDAPLPVAALGNSDQAQVGDWAIAVGNPVGLDNTVTLGIISTLHRTSAEVGIPGKRLDFIQTDAAINPGNSGGPLLSDAGEVIGINTAIRADAMGIGFAIPINKAKSLKDQLVRGEKIAYPYVGVQMTTLTPQQAQENNKDPNSPFILPEIDGALVMKVFPNTPAAKAGIRWGDVIVSVDGQPIKSANDMQSFVEKTTVGQNLQLILKRGERTQQVAVQTAALENAA